MPVRSGATGVAGRDRHKAGLMLDLAHVSAFAQRRCAGSGGEGRAVTTTIGAAARLGEHGLVGQDQDQDEGAGSVWLDDVACLASCGAGRGFFAGLAQAGGGTPPPHFDGSHAALLEYASKKPTTAQESIGSHTLHPRKESYKF